jgi:hypothetical protein
MMLAVSLVMASAPQANCQQARAAGLPANTALVEERTQPGTQENQKGSPAPAATNPSPPQQPAQLDKDAQRIKRNVEKLGVGSRLTAFLRNGDELHGAISRIDPEGFELVEVDLKEAVKLQYKYVKKVRSGYGGVNLLTGKRASPRRGFSIALFAGVMFMAIGLPMILIGTAKD